MVRGQIDWLMEQGVEAARSGDTRRARDTFIRVIELHRRHKSAWLWLSKVVETQADKAVCLENVLTIDPDDQYAIGQLRKLRRRSGGQVGQSSQLPRLTKSHIKLPPTEKASDGEEATLPGERPCPRCGFRNPGWAYVCDRCGADLQPVDVHKVLGPAARERQASFITVLEAWGTAFVFNRLWTFLPELKMASLWRSFMALTMAALFSSTWRMIAEVSVSLLSGRRISRAQFISEAMSSANEVPLLILLLVLIWMPAALLTWIGARMLGGRRDLRTHAHLTAVALSSWVAVGSLWLSIPALASPLIWRFGLPLSLLRILPIVLRVAVGAMGLVWLTQAVQTAQRLSAFRASLLVLILVGVASALLYALNLSAGGRILDALMGLFSP